MPEGHTIHRLARDHRRKLTGGPLAISSPQGRAADAAAVLDGGELRDVDAFGKHLLYRFTTAAGEERTLHVHLGLFGRFRPRRVPPPEPRGQLRLRIVGAEHAADLSGPTACALMDPAEEHALLARLGPDPLRADADPARFLDALARRRISIAQALMDQSVIAGVGNVYRAEALHAERLDPHLPARELGEDRAAALWMRIAAQLADGVEDNRIVTAPGAREKPGRVRRSEAVCVYRRTACWTCGGSISSQKLVGRVLWWCPACQPAAGVSAPASSARR
ncbi:hypothetical protein LRS13_05590 [Svornostia abyssi]|uniref:DNA-(apurinic or apyrimidinic site) lyase n=1 Tax=Svornostia abyssi TaxID=2898438 RepID=A0ABY5PJZ8_9ACTN|nr:hypothetical protein LRS13_05590 [Parviterribacteraceae bacterium J379]